MSEEGTLGAQKEDSLGQTAAPAPRAVTGFCSVLRREPKLGVRARCASSGEVGESWGRLRRQWRGGKWQGGLRVSSRG